MLKFVKILQREKKKGNEVLVVHTGDVFDYCIPDANTVNVFMDVFRQITSLCDLVVIKGNHDLNSKNSYKVDEETEDKQLINMKKSFTASDLILNSMEERNNTFIFK